MANVTFAQKYCRALSNILPQHIIPRAMLLSETNISESYLIMTLLTLKMPDKLQPYGLYVYYVVHICDFGMLRVKKPPS